MRLDAVEEDAEVERFPIVARMRLDADPRAACAASRSKSGNNGSGAVARISMPQCCSNASATLTSCHRQPGIGSVAAPGKGHGAGRRLAGAQQALAIGDQVAPRSAGPIPFEHREFGVVRGAALAVAKHVGELPDPRHAGHQQLFHREFRRGMEIAPHSAAVARVVQFGGEGLQMRFEPWADLQRRGVDLDKPLPGEKIAHRREHPAAPLQPLAPPG